MILTTTEEDVDGLRFHLNQGGERQKEAVLWLHGSGPGATAMSNWERVIGELGDDFYNLAPDIIGFGDSSHPDPAPQGLASYTELRVESLLGLLDKLDIQRCHLVGNSYGGFISLYLALRVPDRIGRMVLMGSGGAPVERTPELTKVITFYDNPTAEAMADLLTCFVYDPAFFGGELRKIAELRLPRATREDVRRSHLATFSPGPPPPPLTDQVLGGIENQTLIIHGREDRVIPLAAGQYFAQRIPNAQLHVFPKTGHWVQIEQHRSFVALVRAFLTGSI
jgi:2-hydroxymuconate-semialdehyde hydrolase